MPRRTQLTVRELARFVAALAVFTSSSIAQTTIVVNDTSDLADFDLTDNLVDGNPTVPGEQRTLRAAIQHACWAGGSYVIELPAATMLLTIGGQDDVGAVGDLDIRPGGLTALTIRCSTGNATIDASPLWTIPAARDRVFDVRPLIAWSVPIVLEHLTLTGGSRPNDEGGAIRCQGGTLTLNDVTITNSSAVRGGAIYTLNDMNVNSGRITSCSASSSGGALYVGGGSLTQLTAASIDHCSSTLEGGAITATSGSLLSAIATTLDSNSSGDGGALCTRTGTWLYECFVTHNTASGLGGGIAVLSPGLLSAARMQVRFNSAVRGGGLHLAPGTLLAGLVDSMVDSNTATLLGGGISNQSEADLSSSTVSRNNAATGGGIDNEGVLYGWNCTVSSNTASALGGGLYILAGGGTASSLQACTVAFNQAGQGGGFYIDPVLGPPQCELRSTLIGNNRNAFSGASQNCAGSPTFSSYGFNLDSDGTCALPLDIHGTLAFPLDPLLGPLQNNGGLPDTHELTPCSPALERGAPTFLGGSPIAYDERGVARTGLNDIGAFEAPFGISTWPTVAFCFGDGTGTQCPCGNNALAGSATGCVNSHGTAAMLTATGLTSVSAANLVLSCSGVPANASALFFQSAHTLGGGLGLPFGDGLLCLASPVLRLGLVTASAGGVANYPGPGQLPVAVKGLAQPGDTIHYQCWYRDPANHCTPATYNLSNALRVVWCP